MVEEIQQALNKFDGGASAGRVKRPSAPVNTDPYSGWPWMETVTPGRIGRHVVGQPGDKGEAAGRPGKPSG